MQLCLVSPQCRRGLSAGVACFLASNHRKSIETVHGGKTPHDGGVDCHNHQMLLLVALPVVLYRKSKVLIHHPMNRHDWEVTVSEYRIKMLDIGIKANDGFRGLAVLNGSAGSGTPSASTERGRLRKDLWGQDHWDKRSQLKT